MSIYRMRTEFAKFLKPILYVIAGIFVVGAFFQFGVMPNMQQKNGPNSTKLIANVNGEQIQQIEFDNNWTSAIEKARDMGIHSPLQYADIKASIISQLIQGRLLMQAASNMGVDISDKSVSAEVDKFTVEYLKQSRLKVLGKISKEQEKIDPREDKAYTDELAANDISLRDIEDQAKSNAPIGEIKTRIAVKGIQDKIAEKVGDVSDKDVENSYNVESIRIILLSKGKSPEEQLARKADSIVNEAKSGADFNKLAKQYSDLPGKTANPMNYSYDSKMMFPPEVQEEIAKMKIGDVSAIKSNYGTFIVKFDKVTPKLPAMFDKKAKDKRRNQIKEDSMKNALTKFQMELDSKQKVEILDPEMLGYWEIAQAQKSSNPLEYNKKLKLAAASLRKAVGSNQSNDVAWAKLAQLEAQRGNKKEAIDILSRMLDSENSSVDAADLRILLGDLYVKSAQKAKAVEQFGKASQLSLNSAELHQQLVDRYKALGNSQLVAKELAWIANFKKWQEKNK